MTFRTWLDNLKTEKPELTDFVEKLSPYFDGENFKNTQFEEAVNKGSFDAGPEQVIPGRGLDND